MPLKKDYILSLPSDTLSLSGDELDEPIFMGLKVSRERLYVGPTLWNSKSLKQGIGWACFDGTPSISDEITCWAFLSPSRKELDDPILVGLKVPHRILYVGPTLWDSESLKRGVRLAYFNGTPSPSYKTIPWACLMRLWVPQLRRWMCVFWWDSKSIWKNYTLSLLGETLNPLCMALSLSGLTLVRTLMQYF